ncbi:substrate-binding domain-containing protein [Nocardioides halotolerans]|jgi:simple sugar transport system substrate-binding protein|uniref:substrate-binding domain-containing protein n=1 Tax=Nocardioides halotolerans TaxID=433660 RepID=UPI00040C1E1D|nr:substrate-binding domain-containing protein [Nocardioides halotolerans]
MKAPKLGLAAAVAAVLVLSACGSGQDSDDDSGDGDSKSADMKICMYTHGDGGGFWSVAKKGAEKAADDLGVELDYQESNNDPEAQAQLIEAGVSGGCDGIAVSAPNPDAIQGAMDKANDAGIPLVTMNSGSAVFQDLHAFTHVGQDEFIAGQEAGKKFKELGATKVLCPLQEASNIGLQQRCDGAKDTFGNVENLQLSAGLADLTKSEAEIQAKLESDPDIDAIFSLNADIATGSSMPASEAAGRDIINGTVDLSGDAVQAIADGDLAFAIDQQQFAQGYLPVVLLYLNKLNGHVLGGGQPMYTGPGFVTQENAELVQKLAEQGTR